MKKTYEELEVEVKGILVEISVLEEKWELEENEVKLAKLESKLERLEIRKDKLYDRMDAITDTETGEDPEKEEKNEEDKEDGYICMDCGGNLQETEEEGVFECVKCGELYEDDGK